MAKKVTAKKTKEETLETILFNCRDYLRGKAQMTDKRDLLLTLVFVKFIGDRFNQCREQITEEVKANGIDDEAFIQMQLNNPNQYMQDGIFYLEEDCLWDALIEVESKDMALAFDNCIAKLETIEVGRDQSGYPIRPLKNALPQQIFTKTALDSGVLKKVCDEINKIDPKRFVETDLIGRVYEYFLQAFSINADKEEGEFYTPHSIVELIAALIEPYDGTIYDPACGSGGMFVQSLKMIAAHGGNTKAVSVYGQESEPATYRLCKMNLAIRGISYNLGERAASTFTEDQHKDMKMDYIMANPPFNLKKWRDETQLLDDPRWKGYDVPPVSNANYGWILHILSKLNVSKGIGGFLLANGALDDSDTKAIREQLIVNDKVEAIIMLPRDMFYTTDISVTLWILNNNKKGGPRNGRLIRNHENEVLFIDLRTWNENIYEKKYVKLGEEQIQRVCDIYRTWQTSTEAGGSVKVDGLWSSKYESAELYYSASKDEILEKESSLVPNRYIKFIDRDIYSQENSCPTDLLSAGNSCVSSLKETIKHIEETMKALSISVNSLKHCELEEISTYLEPCDEKNTEEIYGVNELKGVTSGGVFDKSKAKTEGLNFKNYKVVRKGDFAYNPSRINLGSIALCDSDVCIISPMYQVFRIKDDCKEKLVPEYLNMWFKRKEFQRSTLFYASGSVRDTFSFEEMKHIKIPIPSIDVQNNLGLLYTHTVVGNTTSAVLKELSETISQAFMKSVLK